MRPSRRKRRIPAGVAKMLKSWFVELMERGCTAKHQNLHWQEQKGSRDAYRGAHKGNEEGCDNQERHVSGKIHIDLLSRELLSRK